MCSMDEYNKNPKCRVQASSDDLDCRVGACGSCGDIPLAMRVPEARFNRPISNAFFAQSICNCLILKIF